MQILRQGIDERQAVANYAFVGGGRPKALTCAWLILEQFSTLAVLRDRFVRLNHEDI